jgi:hypothetical protein
MTQNQINKSLTVTVALLVIAVVALAITGFKIYQAPLRTPSFNTPYQMVVLANGQAYFGKIENYGSQFAALTNVYYIQTQVDEDTKKVSNTLVKRGKEWHAPDRMILNTQQILFVESVAPDSEVSKLIQELTGKEK